MTAGKGDGRVVAIADRASLDEGGGRLLALSSLLLQRGVTVELLVPAFGPDLDDFRRTAPTWVIQGLRLRTLRPAAPAVPGDRRVVGSRALRRWLSSRAGSAFLVLHPMPDAIVQHLPLHRGPVVGVLPDPWSIPSNDSVSAHDQRFRPATGPDEWIVFTASQAAQVGQRTGVATPVVEALPHPSEKWRVLRPSPGAGTIVLLVSHDQWSCIDHAVEIAWRVARALPQHKIRWVDCAEDRWLSEHDVRHAGLEARVELADIADPAALDDAGVVIRTGYTPSAVRALSSAGLRGIPVVSFASDDLPAPLSSHRPLDVDDLVSEIVKLAQDTTGAVATGSRFAAGLRALRFADAADTLVSLLQRADEER